MVERIIDSYSDYSLRGVFDNVSIRIASPEVIHSWSRGEVKNPETINYRTFKPEKGGLFCERIFGPTKDWECSCGKYKRIKHKGAICDRCGVEVTQSKVRRERMGHIVLAVPVSHIWFFKTMPSRIGNILEMSSRSLERILYYEDYVVVDPKDTPLEAKQLLSEMEYREARAKYNDNFVAMIGAEAVRELLKKEDLDQLSVELRNKMLKTKSKQTLKKISKRLKIVEGFRKSKNNPAWMIMSVIPVIPPDLRPLVPLEGGRFATSDLNDLYRRVINRNNRLKSILELKTPDVIIRNEKRMLQEAVDALFDNGRHGRPVVGTGNRPLKSLSDMLKGKQGRFRQNLLGKRVDYSGRSVIVVGPELKLHQCGLPKKMAMELFEPFIIRRLKERGSIHTIRSAKKMIERGAPEVWDILEEVTKGHPVLLNRAPTLHRLGIQAFEPLLVEGKALRIHPLVCAAFNADFDGDQMAVHVPLSTEAQLETRMLMLASNNIFSPSSGKPITTPSQDITLGCYYLTKEAKQAPETVRSFATPDEVLLALDSHIISLHEKVKVRLKGESIITTAGRIIFNEIMPPEVEFVNYELNKKQLGKLIMNCYEVIGHNRTVLLLDKLKNLGFQAATRAGISISIDDMIIPPDKKELLASAREEINEVERQYHTGSITDGERYNKIIDIWTHTTDTISEAMYQCLRKGTDENLINPVFMMVDSGSRGSRQQIRQLAGMRGLMAKPSGEIIETPILSNFREGLTVLEYFTSTHGARKGLADTALKTADSGYLTRRLVDVSQDVIVTEHNCHTLNGITVQGIYEGEDEIVSLKERVVGRVALEDITNPATGKIICPADGIITGVIADEIEKSGIEQIKIRSVLTCEVESGVCQLCYGVDLTKGNIIELGEAVGIIAAQSIGEPGTQLTMRTFHIGGTASQVFKQPQIIAKNDAIVQYHDLKIVQTKENTFIALNKNGMVSLTTPEGRELEKYSIMNGSVISVADGGTVKKGEAFVKWDPYNIPILSERPGIVRFSDIIEGVTMKKEIDESTGLVGTVIIEHKEELHPQIVLYDLNDEVVAQYSIPANAHIVVEDGQEVDAGNLLAKTPRKVSKTKDITGGLPRVAELFEARRPKDAAEIAKIDGIIEFGGTVKGKRRIIVRDPETGAEEEHLTSHGKHLTVYKGDRVKKGQQLTEGPIVPQEILQVCGPKELQEYLVNQIQEVYRLQGVEINDKHIELIIRQMLKKIRITEPGDTSFLYGEQVDKIVFNRENRAVIKKGGKPAEATTILQGITKASLSTSSFISAASFQETTRVLTDAASSGRIDRLRGFKENVIMGHLIPAGPGFRKYSDFEIAADMPEVVTTEKEEV
ncbi:MAG: DNA-directed RNA polymerase subunit beta' [Candidatus Auribacterota bacterium]|nr:DNA-directed RNA polymerase subunit beta' [Candidatus Auribacterota bacterium]